MDNLHKKYELLKENLKSLGSVAVAFSSGVDSTFLLKVAHDTLGDGAVAITASSCLMPKRENNEADAFCKSEGIKHICFTAEPLEIEGFAQNPKDRCYICKRDIFIRIKELAAENNIAYVLEGSNTDDVGDYRPGMRAIAELEIKSPLRKAGLSKADIRLLSRELGLTTWDKPSFACLASRFVYGETITEEKLSTVDKAEQRLLDLGFKQFRVRIHGSLARIEVEKADLPKLLDNADEINEHFKSLGFLYVTLDLGGYVMGSMNKTV